MVLGIKPVSSAMTNDYVAQVSLMQLSVINSWYPMTYILGSTFKQRVGEGPNDEMRLMALSPGQASPFVVRLMSVVIIPLSTVARPSQNSHGFFWFPLLAHVMFLQFNRNHALLAPITTLAS